MIYWDTSCVLKLYTAEPDSAVYLAAAGASTDPLLSSGIVRAELYYALRQKELRGDIRTGSADRLIQQFENDCNKDRWVLTPVGQDVLAQANEIARACYGHQPPVHLRTLDGVHLATAVLTQARKIATTDLRMRAAAAVLKLPLHVP